MRFYASLRDSIYRIIAIDNLARFVFHLVIASKAKQSIIKQTKTLTMESQKIMARFKVIDCHDSVSQNLAMTESYQMRHCKQSEAIHNQTNQNTNNGIAKNNGEILLFRLPRR